MGCKCAAGFAREGSQCVNETQCSTFRLGKLKGKGKGGKGKNRTATQTESPTSSMAESPAPTPSSNTSEVLFVGPFRQKCDRGGTGKCLVTKSVQASEFSAFAKTIEGFDFKPGFDYKLRVRSQRIKPRQIAYTLVTLVSKTPTLQTKPGKGAIASVAPIASGCAEVVCMVFCGNGYKKDDKGCEMCSCLPATTEKICPDVTCDNLCPGGYQRNAAGCATCNCAPVPTTLLAPPAAHNCNSAADWTLAKVAVCCVPLPAVGSMARAFCQGGFQNGFLSLTSN